MKRNDRINNAISRLIKGIRDKKTYLTVLSCIVVFITTYALILPALTLDQDEAFRQGGVDIDTQIQSPAKEESASQDSGAATFEGRGFQVTADLKGARLPEDASLDVQIIKKSDEEYEDLCAKALKAIQKEDGKSAIDLKFARFYDISLQSDGKDIEPAVPADITISYDKALSISDAEHVRIVHFGAEKTEVLDPEIKTQNGRMSQTAFETDGFSVFAVVDAADSTLSERTLTAEGKDYDITVTYSEEAQIPDGADLSVSEIKKAESEYEEYIAQTEDAFGENQRVTFARFFDISILQDGQEIQPAAPIEVRVDLKDQIRKDVKAVHFGDKVDVIDADVEKKTGSTDKTVVFDAEGFSVYGIVTVETIDELDGKSFGIVNNQNTVSGTALMRTASNNNTRLQGKTVTIRTEPVKHTGNVFVAQDSSIDMWTLQSAGDNKFYISVQSGDSFKYLRLGTDGVTLVDQTQIDDDCLITVAQGTGQYEGKYKLYSQSRALAVNGNTFTAVSTGTNNGNVWMNFAELSNLTEEDFVTYSATKVSVSDTVNVPDGAQIILYTRIWNDQTLRYDYYIVDDDGKLVKAYESGDQISWVGCKINTMLWDFTEYHYEDGTPNNYYELQNNYSGKYIAPQVSGEEFLSDNTIGLNLNGRRYGQYYTTILAWDDPYYDYVSLKAENGKLIPVPMSQAADFYFAIMTPLEEQEELTTVETFDHTPYGITLKMRDYENINSNNRSQEQVDVLGNTPYNQWTGSPGLLTKNLNGDYPDVVNSTHSLEELYTGAMEVNQQFISSTYEETGYFEYDSTQNFAHLITSENDKWFGQPKEGGGTYAVGDFVIYNQLGTTDEGNKDTLRHGQFLPYNDLEEGNISRKYTNEMDIHAKPLSSLDPRKGEELYNIPYRQGQTAPNFADHFFGMEMSASFMQSENGLDQWGHDLIFEFSGDDDFWLYVDGMLVLDLGGIHSALDGSINFKTGKVIVNGRNTNLRTLYEEAYREKNPDADTATVNAWLNTIFKDDGSNTGTVFKDYSGHTMRMFYMERGAGASNIHMRFNLAPYTQGEVQLEKEVTGTDNVSYTKAKYPFQIWYKDPARPDDAFVLWDKPAKVTDLLTGEPAEYSASAEIGGRTYEHVFFLQPEETVSILLPSEDIEYFIRECGMDSDTYDAVYFNRAETPLEPTEETAEDTFRDYQIDPATVGSQKKVIYTNHVSEQALKKLIITKKLWADQSKTHEWTDDKTPFRFRIYIGKDENDEYSVYSFGKYHVKDSEGHYCFFENGAFVSSGKTDFSELGTTIPIGGNKSEQERATFYTSQGGAIDKIPAGYSIEIPELMDGTPFLVVERENEIPAGYELIDYDLHFGDTTSHDNSGVISTTQESPELIVNNRHGYGLTVKKVWSDKDFMESHDPIYAAVYRKDGTMVEHSLRQIKSPSTSYTWFFEELEEGKTLNDYEVYEVDLTVPEGGSITVDSDTGEVSGYDTITRIEDNGTLTVGGTTTEHGYSADYVYTASYSRQLLTQQQIDDMVNSRTDTVTNARPGIKLVKTDLEGNPLEGGVFTLSESGTDNSKRFTSSSEGLIAVAYLAPDKEYILEEIASPPHFRNLISTVTIKVTIDEDGKYALLVNGSENDDENGFYTIQQVPNPTVSNTPTLTVRNKPFTLKAIKTDAETGRPIQGAVFAVFPEKEDFYSGEPIPDYFPLPGFDDLTTDENGVIPKITTEDLPAGTYYLREKGSPSGYKSLGGDIRFTITETGQIIIRNAPEGAAAVTSTEDDDAYHFTMTIKNTPNKTVQILKKSNEGTQPALAGVEFALYRIGQIENGHPKEGEEPLITATSDENGIVNLGALNENRTYCLIETKTLAGYRILDAPVVITVTSNQITATLNETPLEKELITIGQKKTWQITLYNYTGYELPQSGGPGTTWIYILGSILLIGCGITLVARRRVSGRNGLL